MFYYRTKDSGRVTQDGKRRYTQRRLKIGDFGPMTVGQAREQAQRWAARVELGEDPKADRDGRRGELTVAELYQKALDGHWDNQGSRDSGWYDEVRRNWENHLQATFGALKIGDLDAPLVRKWHGTYREKSPYAGNRSLAVLKKMFSYAISHLKHDRNPCTGIEKHPERKRTRYASVPEMKKLGEVLQRESFEHPVQVAFIYTLALSGSRPRALERARWDQLQRVEKDGQAFGLLTFEGKTSKTTGEPEQLVLPPEALTILDKLPRTSSGLVFGIKMPRAFWERIREEVGCPDLWARDWRRAFASVGLSKSGLSMDKISPLLNHWTTETTKLYAKLIPSAKLQAAGQVGNHMAELLSVDVEPTAKDREGEDGKG
jgi:integrase